MANVDNRNFGDWKQLGYHFRQGGLSNKNLYFSPSTCAIKYKYI